MGSNDNKEQERQTNRNKSAIALAYSPNDTAPKVIASGQGYLADKIIDKAQEEAVPIHKDSKLANTLSKLDVGEYIPPELYNVVAEILVFVDSMDRIKGKVTAETNKDNNSLI
ncbi:EscU/YscU/HrcU family type III secretion system export apparatus switch protein [Anaerosporobacter sp.]|uniref:EscU/YscU/HrcU family type III secretion system export apparatus switch protein n=1 Tax=Anaerosporobacter sp. TaxID=1872529 RepID=UPI00286EF864|nr:EscU/YscU/HrcU family type III secretion system export apparatus switch protein [Anaerosporobacter sp.]